MEKQKAVDEHESNFTAGRVNVRERYLHRTGIRGRKSWLFFAVLYILTLIVIVNLVVSMPRQVANHLIAIHVSTCSTVMRIGCNWFYSNVLSKMQYKILLNSDYKLVSQRCLGL